MPDTQAFLTLAKDLALEAAGAVRAFSDEDRADSRFSDSHHKELKSRADTILDEIILGGLKDTGLPILTEESGLVGDPSDQGLMFIVDPLDGTYNFVSDLGPSAISIALWEQGRPVFGVIYDLMREELSWGGRDMGSFRDGSRISVSEKVERIRSAICTGFPVRADLEDDMLRQEFWALVTHFSKVRMLGSAAISLLQVATGAAEMYYEENIMLWDIAGGLAILEGAGGTHEMIASTGQWCYQVKATNGRLRA